MRSTTAFVLAAAALAALACGGAATPAAGDATGAAIGGAGVSAGYSDWAYTTWTFTDGDAYAFDDGGKISRSWGSPRTGTWTGSGDSVTVDFAGEKRQLTRLGGCSIVQQEGDRVWRATRSFPSCAPRGHSDPAWTTWRFSDGDTYGFGGDDTVGRSWGSGRSGKWTRSGDTLKMSFGSESNEAILLDACHLAQPMAGQSAWRATRLFPPCAPSELAYAGLDHTLWRFSDGDTYALDAGGKAWRSWGSPREGTWKQTGDGFELTFGGERSEAIQLHGCAIAQKNPDGQVWRASRIWPACL